MRCLYCGKELALLKRLRGGGEFCSDAHKQSYQEEYNKLGLSRLLQARTRTGESQAAQNPPKPASQPVAPVAVEEPVVRAIPVAKTKPVPQAAPPEVISTPEPPPPAMAGFALEKPSVLLPPEPVPSLEPWMSEEEPPLAPPAPEWRLRGPSGEHVFFTLRSGELLPLALQPGVCESSLPLMETSVTPHEVTHPKVQLSMPLSVTWTHEFQAGGSVAIEIAPRPSEGSSYASLNGAVDFSYPAAVQVFDLMDLSPAGIAFPAEDCDVTLPESWTNGIMVDEPAILPVDLPVDITVSAIPHDPPAPAPDLAPVAVVAPAATPRAALEALSKLHQDMREREEAVPAEAPAARPSESRVAVAEPPEPPQPEAAPSEPASTDPSPREANELLAVSLKSFAPPKASPVIDIHALSGNGHPLLPRLKGLPLRPKVAPAPRGFTPQLQQPKAAPPPKAPAEVKKPAQASAALAVESKPKAPAPDKPAESKPEPQPKKVAQPAEAPKPKSSAPASPAAPSAPPAAPPKIEKAAKPESPAKPAPPAKPVPVKTVPPAPGAAQKEPLSTAPAAKPEPKSAAAATASTAISADHTVPNFGAVVNTSVFGSLKVKLGLVALIAVTSIGVYFAATGKSKPSAPPTKAADGAGLSIMVGEGGWVEGWAGDPAGLHNGRQITIYRPSLKLSDYRFEFQGQIENKSIGWIFRAADPENYYAMKVQLVSQELPLKLELYKYAVLKGRQVQVGRVPIDVPVKNDTVFSIRLDVRGPKFSTYLQGQPLDVWTDDQIRSGGVGFLNERSERGKIKSVALSYLAGGAK